jgi:hypothetical protein
MPVILTISPFVLLVAGGALVRFLYARSYRNAWIVALIIPLLAWGILLVLGLLPTTEFSLSNPSPDFREPFSLDFILDDNSWRMALGVMTILISGLLMELSRAHETRRFEQPFLMVFGALICLSLLSAGLLSLILTWTALDVALLVHRYARRGSATLPDPSGNRMTVVMLRVGLLMGALAVGARNHLSGDEFGQLESPIAWALFVAGICSRAAWPTIAQGDDGSSQRHLWPRDFAVAASSGLALMAFGRMLEANPATVHAAWIGALGLTAAIGGGVGVALKRQISDAGGWLALGIIGLGITLGVSSGGSGAVVWDLGLLGMLVSAVWIHSGPFARWERGLIWLSAFIFVGLPPFLGLSGSARLGEAFLSGSGRSQAVLAFLAYALAASAILRSAQRERQEWLSREDLGRVFYAAGLVFPFLPLLGFGLQIVRKSSLPGILVSFAAMLVAFFIADASLRYDIFNAIEPWGQRAQAFLGNAKREVDAVREIAARVVGSAVGTLEGEGAVIWLFVIVLFFALVLGTGAAG